MKIDEKHRNVISMREFMEMAAKAQSYPEWVLLIVFAATGSRRGIHGNATGQIVEKLSIQHRPQSKGDIQ